MNISIYVNIYTFHSIYINIQTYVYVGEKGGILRLLHIYHSTSRVEGLGFDLFRESFIVSISNPKKIMSTTWSAQALLAIGTVFKESQALYFSHRLWWDIDPVH